MRRPLETPVKDPFPVLPFRTEVYGPDELFAGFSAADPRSYASTLDFRAFRSTVFPPTREVRMLRALHDQCITDARDTLLLDRRVVAVMGGHELARGHAVYREVAGLARSLTERGVLVVSGGGPGAMEATHLGALLAGQPDVELTAAIEHLASMAAFPEDARSLVAMDGTVDLDVLERLHAWQVPAFDLVAGLDPASRGQSLAVPTWFYGQEPPTPFASHVAKYFQNSVREDGLLAIAADGVIYARGRAGTVQEVFQDAAQNVYRPAGGRFSPMAFLDTDHCWSEELRVAPVLRHLFGDSDFGKYVRITPDPAEILAFLTSS